MLGPENLKTIVASDNLAETLVYERHDEEAEQILHSNLATVVTGVRSQTIPSSRAFAIVLDASPFIVATAMKQSICFAAL